MEVNNQYSVKPTYFISCIPSEGTVCLYRVSETKSQSNDTILVTYLFLISVVLSPDIKNLPNKNNKERNQKKKKICPIN